MKFVRIYNSAAAETLIPWFVPFNQTRAEIFLELCERLMDRPDETYACVMIHRETIKGMAIAYCRDNDVFLWQARSEGLASKYVDIAFGRICAWAKEKGFRKLTAIPNRAVRLWSRRWGFKESKTGEVYKEL